MADPAGAAFGFTEAQAARQLGVSARTLARWRKRGVIGYVLTPGRRVFYSPEHLHRFRQTAEVRPEAVLLCPHK